MPHNQHIRVYTAVVYPANETRRSPSLIIRDRYHAAWYNLQKPQPFYLCPGGYCLKPPVAGRGIKHALKSNKGEKTIRSKARAKTPTTPMSGGSGHACGMIYGTCFRRHPLAMREYFVACTRLMDGIFAEPRAGTPQT